MHLFTIFDHNSGRNHVEFHIIPTKLVFKACLSINHIEFDHNSCRNHVEFHIIPTKLVFKACLPINHIEFDLKYMIYHRWGHCRQLVFNTCMYCIEIQFK